MEFYNKHYIRLDDQRNIVYGFSDAFEQPQEYDICINEHGGRHFELLGQTNPSLRNDQGVYLYRYVDGEVVAKTQEEIQSEIDALPKPMPIQSAEEKAEEARAVACYVGMMVGVL